MVNYAKVAVMAARKAAAPAPVVNCTITIEGTTATISGQYPLATVRNATSYYVEGYQWTDAFRARKWDGKKHFFSLATHTMPAGLAPLVVEEIRAISPNAKVRIQDRRFASRPKIAGAGFELEGIEFGGGVYDYQIAAAQAMVDGERGVIKVATNGGKTEIAIAVTKHLGLPTLFLVERLELLNQTRARFAKRLGLPKEAIGIVGDGQYEIGEWVTIATPASLQGRLGTDVDPARWQVLFCDECHHVAADTFYNTLSTLPAYFRYAMSGTPLDRSDGADLKLLAQTGPVLYSVSNKLLVERGISVPPYVEMVKITMPALPLKGLTYAQVEKLGVVENDHLNLPVSERAAQHAREGLQVLILVEKKKHGRRLRDLLDDWGSKVQYIHGDESTEVRGKALEDYAEGKIRILIATTILDEGVDVPCIDVLILAAGGKAKIRLLQRVGRGLRTGADKDRLLVIDFANFTHKWLLKHSLMRLRTYKNEECFLISAA